MSENKRPLKSPVDNGADLDLDCCASSMDCTGLIQTPPENDEALESYRDIYDFGPPDPDDYQPEYKKEKF